MALEWRGEALEDLAGREFDLLVVGAGIVGAGIASEASRAGLVAGASQRSRPAVCAARLKAD